MRVTEGLWDHMVLQRNAQNVSDTMFSGTCHIQGRVRLTVLGRGARRLGWRHRMVGRAEGGRFTGRLRGLPTGGPYHLNLEIVSKEGTSERLRVQDVLVGDVWVVAGQSNAQGCGRLKEALQPHPKVRAYFMDNRWRVARDPIHNLWRAVAPVHATLCGGVLPGPNRITGTGPAVAFGQRLFERTGVPQGLIASAHGGTSMSQWDPRLKRLGEASLYGAMLARIRRNGGRVAGLIWYQGESDANEENAPQYTERMRAWIRALRRDLQDPTLPVVLAQIGRVIGWPDGLSWNSIQDQQRRLPDGIDHCAVVPTVDLLLDDLIHLSGAAQTILGRRMADAILASRGGRRTGRLLPPDLQSVLVERDKRRPGVVVVVTFKRVHGKLVADGRPVGFSVVNAQGVEQLYDVRLVGRRAVLQVITPPARTMELTLWYGRGTNPVCNIRDEADRPIPVFGPIRIAPPRAVTPMIRRLRVSRFLPSAGRLHRLGYPSNRTDLGLRPREFLEDFCNLHSELGTLAPQDVLVFYACDFTCSERMGLRVLLGYDGPVKVWVDGRRVYHDPNGTNPAIPETASIPVVAGKGRHEILVALGSNYGRAWGIFLALERVDVPRAKIEKGPSHYAMPEVLG